MSTPSISVHDVYPHRIVKLLMTKEDAQNAS